MASSLRTACGVTAFLMAVAAAVGRSGEGAADLVQEEKTLREAGLKTDGLALLEFFRERSLTDEQRERLAALIHQLGDDTFVVRQKASMELARAGRAALPMLRAAARDPDPEVARRAADCLTTAGHESDLALVVAATRLLAERRPAGAAEALLAYLPSLDDDVAEDAVLAALLRVGLTEGKPVPALRAALAEREPSRRAAAAFVVGRAAPQERRAVVDLLADPEPRVRFRAAAALVRGGDRSAVDTLLTLLGEGPLSLAVQAEDLLGRLAGAKVPPVGLGNGGAAARRACRQAWQEWWKANGEKIDLAKVDFEEAQLGLTIVCDCDVPAGSVGRVWECRADGKPRWQIEGLGNPCDVQVLPGGRLLIAEYQAHVVTERDRQGKVLWSHRVTGSPVSCQRLPNGNTFIAASNELLEVTPDGKVVYSHRRGNGSIYCGQKLPNGNLLFAEGNGNVVEMDLTGKEVRSVAVGGLGSWAGLEPLSGGRYLVAQYANNRVVEVDAVGKVLWECAVASPAWATRLRSGNTLVASTDGRMLFEFDRAGKEVWKVPAQGRPFRVRRY